MLAKVTPSLLREIIPEGVKYAETFGDHRGILLPPEEAALGKSTLPKRRAEIAAGRTCARSALGELGLRNVVILPGANREPLWPAGITGSITHCTGYCAAAVAPVAVCRSIGVDAEENQPLPTELLHYISTSPERLCLSNLPAQMIHWDRLLFVLKEAFFKAWFPMTQRFLEFHDAEVSLVPCRKEFAVKVSERALKANPGPDTIRGRYAANERFIVASAILDPRSDPDVQRLTSLSSIT